MTVIAFAPRSLRGLETQIDFYTLIVRIERMRRLVRILLEQRAMKMPNLQGVGPALAKLQHGLEDRAKTFLDQVAAAEARAQNTFDRAGKHLVDANGGITEISTMLDQIDKATNGDPTSGGSAPSPVGAQPGEGANLNQGTAG